MSKRRDDFVALLVFLMLGITLYFPILDNVFLSDDYDSLYRICVEKTIIVKEFFRPLIDISFKFNYFLGGLNPVGYYIFNLLIHIINTYLVYRIALDFKVTDKDQQLFAWFSALLFILYPFHNEGVVWLTGRLTSIGCLFALLSIRLIFSGTHNLLKAGLMVMLYFTGMLAYESILLLPFIILVFVWNKTFSIKRTGLLSAACLGVIIAYLFFRYYASDVVYGEYGNRMTDSNVLNIIIKAVKTLGRTILPPSENSELLIILFILSFGIIIVLNKNLYKKYRFVELSLYIKLLLVFGVSMIIPILFGISTRTSESDRLLYFPSVFLCMILAFLLLALTKTKMRRMLFFFLLSIYFIVCLMMNNLNWEEASRLAGGMLNKVQDSKNKQIIIINMPDEVEGAFVYRNGFYKAMVLNKLDTGKILVNNYLSRLEYLKLEDETEPVQSSNEVFLPPVSKIFFLTNDSICVENIENKNKAMFHGKNVAIIYWNKTKIRQLF